MASFEECGIKWLSASSISNYCANPAYWVVRYLIGERGRMVPAICRADAVYHGTKTWCFGADQRTAEDWALGEFEMNTQEMDPGERAKEHDAILPMLDETCKLFQAFGFRQAPLTARVFNTVWLEGISASFVTKPDFEFPDCIVDLKTTHALPSSIREKDLINGALHMLRRGKPVFVCYATMKKAACYQLGRREAEEALVKLTLDAVALQNFVDRIESPEQALSMVPLNEKHFLWSPELLAVARSKHPQLPKQEIPTWALPSPKP
jgi:hypothetical protein